MKRMRTIEGPLFEEHGLGLTSAPEQGLVPASEPAPAQESSIDNDNNDNDIIVKEGQLVDAVTDALMRSLLKELSSSTNDHAFAFTTSPSGVVTMSHPTGTGAGTGVRAGIRAGAGAGAGVEAGVDVAASEVTNRLLEGVRKRERALGVLLEKRGEGGVEKEREGGEMEGGRGVDVARRMGSDRHPSPPLTRSARVISPPLPSSSPLPSPPLSPIAIHKRMEGRADPNPNPNPHNHNHNPYHP